MARLVAASRFCSQDSVRKATMRFLTLCLLLLFAASGAAIAGPLEDGLEAYKKGDFDTAVRLLRPLAEQGNPQAEEKLGRLYQRGKGVPKDFERAVEWYRKAAEQGEPAAQGRLGFLYRVGAGVPRDLKVAKEWYTKAAEQGNPLAQVGLGYMLMDGSGDAPDVVTAATWFEKAAKQGDALAMLALGTLYELGRGVAKDFVQAHKWYALASVDDGEYEQDLFERAKRAKEELARQMTPAQIAEAERLARAAMPPGR
jgi:TPR repeat protein